jgi:hypothetical protein
MTSIPKSYTTLSSQRNSNEIVLYTPACEKSSRAQKQEEHNRWLGGQHKDISDVFNVGGLDAHISIDAPEGIVIPD